MTFGPNVDENQLMDAALEVGADDVILNEDGSKEVLTSPWELSNIKEQLQKMGLVPEFSEVTMRAETDVELSGDVATSMQKLLDALENLDDVQDVYSNAILEE